MRKFSPSEDIAVQEQNEGDQNLHEQPAASHWFLMVVAATSGQHQHLIHQLSSTFAHAGCSVLWFTFTQQLYTEQIQAASCPHLPHSCPTPYQDLVHSYFKMF